MSEERKMDWEHPMLIQFIELLADILVAPANPKREAGRAATANLPALPVIEEPVSEVCRDRGLDSLAPKMVE